MGLMDWIFGARESAPRAEPVMIATESTRAAPARTARPTAQRNYSAAGFNRLTADWMPVGYAADNEIRRALKPLRDRSRELSRNNDYVKHYLKLIRRHVFGPAGIQLEMQIRTPRGKRDDASNEIIEAAWAKWSKKGVCTVDGKLSWVQAQWLIGETVARDGEAIVRFVRGFPNGFGFALQLLEGDYLDHLYNRDDLPDGRFIRMSVEFDKWRRPVAYWLRTQHPGEFPYTSYAEAKRERVDAADVLLIMRPDRFQQTRGVPELHSAMSRLQMLGGFEEAALTAARVGASKMGFFTSEADQDAESSDLPQDDIGNLLDDVEAGHLERLPPGVKFDKFDPQYPSNEFPGFMKAMLRGAASGLGVDYNTLANDLERVTYSSMRSGVLEVRDEWRVWQRQMIDELMTPVFEAWLTVGLGMGLIGAGALPVSQMDRWNKPRWQPRGWGWVDPDNESKALVTSIGLGVRSRTQACAEMGRDIEDVFEDLRNEKELAATYGLALIDPVPGGQTMTNPQTDAPAPDAAPADAGDDDDAESSETEA